MAKNPAKVRDPLKTAATRIRRAMTTGRPCKPIRDLIKKGDLDSAYAIQQINTEIWIKENRRPVGRKIGLTAKTVQLQLGVDQPDFGVLYADMEVVDGDEIGIERLMQPKAEGEIALVLDDDLVDEQLTLVDLIDAVAYALPAIEVVGSRIANWDINILDTIADNASSGLYVLGTRPVGLHEIDLRMCGMVMENKGDQVSIGAGAACLGNPLNAALWLARKMVQVGMPLMAGDTIMTGALGPMAPVTPGDVIEVRISGLGSVRAVFGK
ncbi:MAG: 2-keto-4-pentenoate hydratase [Rhodospirillaceae bacterium]|jgi:2-keto-4-pentenoate hydratase|nr:2-keto-4-pentenoate hydratase [Rhodospirillaceae bacterium]|tara:strand:+ start:130 stop:933 length:804 start_codon:yes stop_codon:yes gene_type:complete